MYRQERKLITWLALLAVALGASLVVAALLPMGSRQRELQRWHDYSGESESTFEPSSPEESRSMAVILGGIIVGGGLAVLAQVHSTSCTCRAWHSNTACREAAGWER